MSTVIRSLAKTRKAPIFSNFFFFSTASNSIDSNLIAQYFSLLNSSPNSTHLRRLHARLLRTSLYTNVVLSSKLVLMYSRRHNLLPYSLSTFLHMPCRNLYSWNIIIGEFSRSDFPQFALELFVKMWREFDERPDDFSFPLVLRACAGCGLRGLGISVHGLCVKLGWDGSLFVGSALVFMYVTFGRVFDARVVFDEMPERDFVLWTSMLAGYVQHGESLLGLEVFREMSELGIKLDGVVMVSLLLICGQLGWSKHGKSVHGWCIRNCSPFESSLGNAIIDFYVKCAVISNAHKVFDQMPKRDVFSWSSLILGYGLIGNANAALWLFDRMRSSGIKPNNVTFLGVLSACAHNGLVEQARLYFELMKDYNVVPELKHYANMVDCLSRAGHCEEAERLVEDMPMEPDEAVLGAVMAGCRVHNNVAVGERIAKRLIRLKPEKSGYYVMLSNMYAEVGRFDEAERVQRLMKEHNVYKTPGCSLIETKIS